MLREAMDSLANPVAAVVDPAQAQAELEETRQKILEGDDCPRCSASKDPAPDPEVTPKAPRKGRGPPLERPENMLREAMDSLANPVAAVVDPAQAQAELEETRQKILEGRKR